MKHLLILLAVLSFSLFSTAQIVIDSVITTDETCLGYCDGTITIYTSNATAPVAYDIGGTPQASNVFTGLCPGNYTVTVNDALPSSATTSATIIAATPITFTISTFNCSAFGVCDGQAAVTITGGIPPYTITYFNAGFTPIQSGTNTSIINLCAGTYYVEVTDSNNCPCIGPSGPGQNQFVITQPPPPPPPLVVTQDVYNITCSFNCDGNSWLNVSGGVPPYSYSWGSPGVGGFCAGDAVPGWTVTDNVGQQQSGGPQSIYENIPDFFPLVVNETCAGTCDGTVTATSITGDYQPFTYAINGGLDQASPTFTNLCPGNYTMQAISIYGCTNWHAFTIVAASSIVLSTIITHPVCSGSCDGDALITPSGGTPPYSVNWIPAQPGCAGIYYATITDALGCSVVDTVVLIDPPPIIVTPTFVSNPTVIGACDGVANGSAVGGTTPYSYEWVGCAPTVYNSGALPTPFINTLCEGDFQLVVTDINGCIGVSGCIAMIDPPTGIAANFGSGIERIYPNPTGGTIFIDFKDDAQFPLDINVLDATGKIAYSKTFESKQGAQLNIGHLPKGMYVLSNQEIGLSQSIVLQ